MDPLQVVTDAVAPVAGWVGGGAAVALGIAVIPFSVKRVWNFVRGVR